MGTDFGRPPSFNSRLQVTELAVGHGSSSGDVWKLGYQYGEIDGNGNVDASKNTGNVARQTLSFNGLAQPFVQSYKYDSLYRLTEAKETSNSNQTWKQNFTYDRYGNRLTHQRYNGTDAVANTAITHPHIDPASNRIDSPIYDFDQNGNMIVDGENRKFAFNADNKQREVKDANNILVGEYFYDGEGKRVKKKSYVGGVHDETTVFLYSSGKLVAEYSTKPPPQNPTTNWTVTDMLGSPRLILNSLGEVVSRRDFLPFGEEILPDQNVNFRTAGQKYVGDGVRQKFTGYQKDGETGLDFAEARMYENRHARFTAVDPLLASGKSANPQTFNRYVYVINNPLRYTDPNGLQVALVPGGRWYKPTEPDGVRTYRFESTQPDGYEPVTERNRWGQLIGSFAAGTIAGYDDYHVLKFNEEGPLKALPVLDVRTGQTSIYRLTEEERAGFSIVRGPGFRWTGAVQDVSLELFTAFQGSGALLKSVGPKFFARQSVPASVTTNRAAGIAAEIEYGITGPKRAIESITGTALRRFPEELTETTMKEIKNVRHLSLTRQIMDMHLYSQREGLKFTIVTRPTTTFSRPIQELFDSGLIKHEVYNFRIIP